MTKIVELDFFRAMDACFALLAPRAHACSCRAMNYQALAPDVRSRPPWAMDVPNEHYECFRPTRPHSIHSMYTPLPTPAFDPWSPTRNDLTIPTTKPMPALGPPSCFGHHPRCHPPAGHRGARADRGLRDSAFSGASKGCGTTRILMIIQLR